MCIITTAWALQRSKWKKAKKKRLFTTNEKTYYRNLKSERRPDCHETLPDKQALTGRPLGETQSNTI